MIESIQVIIGLIGVVVGVLCFGAWAETRDAVFGALATFSVLAGLALFFTLPKIETEKPAYSFEWIDEETKCHWYGGKIVNCESFKYTEGL